MACIGALRLGGLGKMLALCAMLAAQACSGTATTPTAEEPSNNRRVAAADGVDLPRREENIPIAGRYRCSTFGTCDFTRFMAEQNVCALLVVADGTIVYEAYDEASSGTCFEAEGGPGGVDHRYGLASVAKSVTSTLLGLAERDGLIDIQSPIATHEPALTGDGGKVVVADALRMRSGLAWDEDNNSLVADTVHRPITGVTALEFAMRNAFAGGGAPGDHFSYSGLDSTLLGIALEGALKLNGDSGVTHLDEALTKWIWQTVDMQGDARWKADRGDTPAPHCCFYMRAADLAKFGQYILDSRLDQAMPLHDWLSDGTRYDGRVDRCAWWTGERYELGYGYQWWVFKNGRFGFTGLGKGGQHLHIVPDDNVAIVQFSANPGNDSRYCESFDAHRVILAAVAAWREAR